MFISDRNVNQLALFYRIYETVDQDLGNHMPLN